MRLRLKAENGFTTVVVMGMLLVGMLLVAAAFASSDGDTTVTRHDQYYKEAYNAAEAGVNWYYEHLTQDPNYWRKCYTDSPPVYKLNPTSFQWKSIPGSQAQYMVELLPAPGTSATCDPNNGSTVIDTATGMFKIRSTGLYRGVKRTIVATFRRIGFLNFLWFTDLETPDPATYATPTQQQWAQTNCAKYYWLSNTRQTSTSCGDQVFATGETMDGPMHSNDELYMCGKPTLGHASTDNIESSVPKNKVSSPYYRFTNQCTGTGPNFIGKWTPGAGTLKPPPTNGQVRNDADPSYIFTGTTHIVLNSDNTMTVNGTTMDMPGKAGVNGVVYVDNDTCAAGWDPTQDYPAVANGTGCGNVYVSGTAASDLTIASANDIIIDGNIDHTTGVVLGLIANNFVRIYHPVDLSTCPSNISNSGGTNLTTTPGDPNHGWMKNVAINAAILALNDSFIVDNWGCGATMGNLTITGAIAQEYRGTVGVVGVHGYNKDYHYYYELRYHQPPFFLDPVQAGWGIIQQTEQVPPAH